MIHLPTDMETLFARFIEAGASDLYLVTGNPPAMKQHRAMQALGEKTLSAEDVWGCVRAFLSPEEQAEFNNALEYNTAVEWQGGVRLRVNVFMQRHMPAMVLRRIQHTIPTMESLALPSVYADVMMERRGLVLVVGGAACGKSSTVAAMVNHRNVQGSGHIVTIEDPVEFLHTSQGCIISQRDVGIDTRSVTTALKNAVRQAPDIIVISEINNAEVAAQAMEYAEAGRLVLTTLYASGAVQAIERVLGMFAPEQHTAVRRALSSSLRGIFAQRLLGEGHARRTLACEVLVNQGQMHDLIAEGKMRELKEAMVRGHDQGMQTFEQALAALVQQGKLTEQAALAESDAPGDLRVLLKQLQMSDKVAALRGDGTPSF